MLQKVTKAAAPLAIAGLLFFIAYTYQKYRIPPAMDFSRIEVTDLLGQRTKILRNPGRTLIVIFYASWCHDCAREMPKLHAAWSKNPEKADVAAITDEGMQSMVGYRNRHRYPFAFYTLMEPFDTYGIEAIPTVYILNAKGEIVFSKVGDVNWESIARAD